MPWKDKDFEFRLNKGTHRVLQALQEMQRLSSAQEICFWLKEHNPDDAPALTTVYRAIESLQKLDLVQSVDIAGERRYEAIEPGEHHHHLICTSCRSSIHLDQCFVETLEQTVEKHHGFQVRSHVLEIFGLCEKCLESQKKGKELK